MAPPDPVAAARLAERVHPATLAQLDHFQALGLRAQMLTLPVMAAVVLSMIWRQVGSSAPLLRPRNREGFLWTSLVSVSEQALSQGLRTSSARAPRPARSAELTLTTIARP